MTPELPIRAAIAAAVLLAAIPAAAHAGDGGFAQSEVVPLSGAHSLAVSDFTNDGLADLAVVLRGGGTQVQIRSQTPDGDLVPGNPVSVGPDPDRIAVADFNRDGNTDLAVTNPAAKYVKVKLGLGDGSFQDAEIIEVAGFKPYDLAVADLNGDGADDLAIPVVSTNGVRLVARFTSNSDGTFAARNAIAIDGSTLVTADLLGDKQPDTLEDLATVEFLGSRLTPVLATPDGGHSAGQPTPLGAKLNDSRALGVADLDADGRTDIVAATVNGKLVALLGNGDGTFAPAKETTLGKEGPYNAVAVGDYDSDGREDVAVADAAGKVAHVLLGDGAGGFSAAPQVPVAGTPTDLAAADFDDDGTLDLVTVNEDEGTLAMRYGTGPGLLAGNLLENGGFEGPTPSGKIQPVGIPGWSLGGGSHWLRYGAPSHAYAPSAIASPRFGTGGARMFWGGASAATGGITSATQTVDVAAQAAAIDQERATVRFSAYLGGSLMYADAMEAKVEYLDAAGDVRGFLGLGPVTPEDRHNVTTLLRREGRAPLPAGTRSIRVTLTSVDADKAYSSALADNVKLTLAVAPPPTAGPRPGPGNPPPPAAGFGALTQVQLEAVRTRVAAGKPLRLRLRNANGFTVTAAPRVSAKVRTANRARRVRGRGPQVDVAPFSGRVVKVALPAALRKQLARRHRARLRAAAVVRDPAGTTRRVAISITLKTKGAPR